MISPHSSARSKLEQGSKVGEAITAQFVLAIAVSGTIAPKLYIRLRKAQNEQRKSNDILLTDMSFKDGHPIVYSPIHSRDPGAEDNFVDGPDTQY